MKIFWVIRGIRKDFKIFIGIFENYIKKRKKNEREEIINTFLVLREFKIFENRIINILDILIYFFEVRW